MGTTFTVQGSLWGQLTGVEIVKPQPDEIAFIGQAYQRILDTQEPTPADADEPAPHRRRPAAARWRRDHPARRHRPRGDVRRGDAGFPASTWPPAHRCHRRDARQLVERPRPQARIMIMSGPGGPRSMTRKSAARRRSRRGSGRHGRRCRAPGLRPRSRPTTDRRRLGRRRAPAPGRAWPEVQRARQHAGLGIGFETVADGGLVTLERQYGGHGTTPRNSTGERSNAPVCSANRGANSPTEEVHASHAASIAPEAARQATLLVNDSTGRKQKCVRRPSTRSMRSNTPICRARLGKCRSRRTRTTPTSRWTISSGWRSRSTKRASARSAASRS